MEVGTAKCKVEIWYEPLSSLKCKLGAYETFFSPAYRKKHEVLLEITQEEDGKGHLK